VGSDDALEGDHSSRSGDRKLSVHVIHFNGVKHLLMTTIEKALAAQVQGLQVLRIGWFTLALSGRNTHFRRKTELDKRHRWRYIDDNSTLKSLKVRTSAPYLGEHHLWERTSTRFSSCSSHTYKLSSQMKGKIKREPSRASSLLMLGDLWPHISVITPQRDAKMRDFHSSQAKWEATSDIPPWIEFDPQNICIWQATSQK